MTIDQLNSLNQDETDMLWFILNVVKPSILPYEFNPNIFLYIDHQRLMDRFNQCEQYVKDEYKMVYNTLKIKIL